MADFLRIPPDSTGKKIRNQIRYDAIISNISSEINISDIPIGTLVTGIVSGKQGNYTGLAVKLGVSTLYLVNVVDSFTVGERLSINLRGTDIEIATFVSGEQYHTQVVNVADPNISCNLQKISNKGSAFVRFNEGE